ncbi:MAG: hypothetical protein RBU36_17920 [Thermoanaerobaculia bacterium]|nr:hypothetical protein [Thermoanaerobaculia bacterium]
MTPRGVTPRRTWNRLVGSRAAGHPPVAPEVLETVPRRVNLSAVLSSAADAAFESGYGYGSGSDASHGIVALAQLLGELGAAFPEALAGLEREYAAGLRQGRANRRRGSRS